jgi:hypothetical protein
MTIAISDTSSAVSLSQVASTLPHLEKSIKDNVTDATPALSFLMGQLGAQMRGKAGMQGDSLPGVIVGGRDIHVPVTLLENTTAASYSGTDTLDVSHQDNDRYALYLIKQNSASLNIIGREKRGNKGEAQIYNLLESKVQNMQGGLRAELTRQIFSDGTGNGGKDLTGLVAVVGTGTLAGINPATYPVWQPGARAAADSRHGVSSAFGSFTTSAAGMAEMALQVNNLTNGEDRPDCILVAQDVFQFFETELVSVTGSPGQIQYTSWEVGWTGFKALEFKGIPMFFDFGATDGDCYYLNSRHLKFERDVDGDFKWLEDDPIRPVDQDVFVKVMIVEGNLVTNMRRSLGKTIGITA